MVAEAIPAPTEVTPEPPVETTDASLEVAAQAPSAPEAVAETPIPEEVQSFLKEQGYSDASEVEGSSPSAKKEAAPDIDPEELKAQGRREEQTRLQRLGRDQWLRDQYKAHESRLLQELDTYDGTTESRNRIQSILASYNGRAQGHHAQGFVDGLYSTMAQELPESDRSSFLQTRERHQNMSETIADFRKAIEAQARIGWVSNKAAKAQADNAVREFTAKATKAGLFSGGKNISTDTSTGSGRGRPDRDLLMDPTTPIDVVRQIRARQKGI